MEFYLQYVTVLRGTGRRPLAHLHHGEIYLRSPRLVRRLAPRPAAYHDSTAEYRTLPHLSATVGGIVRRPNQVGRLESMTKGRKTPVTRH